MLHRKCSAYELRRRQSGPARECTSYADDLRPIHALSNFSKFSQNVYIIVHNLLQILIATKGNHLYHPHTASTRFLINGICHFRVNFFVFCLCLKTKSVLKSLCNLPVEFLISKEVAMIFIFLKNKNVVFHCF